MTQYELGLVLTIWRPFLSFPHRQTLRPGGLPGMLGKPDLAPDPRQAGPHLHRLRLIQGSTAGCYAVTRDWTVALI